MSFTFHNVKPPPVKIQIVKTVEIGEGKRRAVDWYYEEESGLVIVRRGAMDDHRDWFGVGWWCADAYREYITLMDCRRHG